MEGGEGRGQVAPESLGLCRLDFVKHWPGAPLQPTTRRAHTLLLPPTLFLQLVQTLTHILPTAPQASSPGRKAGAFHVCSGGRKNAPQETGRNAGRAGPFWDPGMKRQRAVEVNKSDRGSLFRSERCCFQFLLGQLRVSSSQERWPLSRSLLSTCGKTVCRSACVCAGLWMLRCTEQQGSADFSPTKTHSWLCHKGEAN